MNEEVAPLRSVRAQVGPGTVAGGERSGGFETAENRIEEEPVGASVPDTEEQDFAVGGRNRVAVSLEGGGMRAARWSLPCSFRKAMPFQAEV